MTVPPPRLTRTNTRFPYTTLFRSDAGRRGGCGRTPLPRVAGARAAYGPDRAVGDEVVRRGVGDGHGDHVARAHRVLGHRGEVGLERSEEHTSELQSLMRNSSAVFCL